MLNATANANANASVVSFFFVLRHSAAEIDAFILWLPLSCNKSEEKNDFGQNF